MALAALPKGILADPMKQMVFTTGRIGAGTMRTPIPIASTDEICPPAAVYTMGKNPDHRVGIERRALHDPPTGLPNLHLIRTLLRLAPGAPLSALDRTRCRPPQTAPATCIPGRPTQLPSPNFDWSEGPCAAALRVRLEGRRGITGSGWRVNFQAMRIGWRFSMAMTCGACRS